MLNEYSANAQKIESGQSSRSLPQVRRIVALGTRMIIDKSRRQKFNQNRLLVAAAENKYNFGSGPKRKRISIKFSTINAKGNAELVIEHLPNNSDCISI